MQQVFGNLRDLPKSTKASDLDLIFLKGIMESPVVCSLTKVLQNLSLANLAYTNDVIIS